MATIAERETPTVPAALRLRVGGVVQGVGFRPFVYRLARAHGLAGWVRNAGDGVHIHLEGPAPELDRFVVDLTAHPPPAARIVSVERVRVPPDGCGEFTIRHSEHDGAPTVRLSPDLPICARCLAELAAADDRRHGYPYINCTDCGPRFSIVRSLPYDRPGTTMSDWALCPECAAEYADPGDRRFHAQPVACPVCGPHVRLLHGGREVTGDAAAIAAAALLLAGGQIVAVKGIGGYHLACDAADAAAVAALRERKFRKEKPFAVMARDLAAARRLAAMTPLDEAQLTALAHPIVLAPARRELPGVAPDNHSLGIMLPYTPLHHLLFAHGAPEALVMTSGNRSSEPLAYEDGDAIERLTGIADAFLVGERPIARRVDDSVVMVTALGPAVLRRGRGLAPGAAARLPAAAPILALGADLKNTVTLVVDGAALVSQHIGDLDHYAALTAFRDTVSDLLAMYEVDRERLLVAHDLHPEYASTRFAADELGFAPAVAVQHHRAHVASVLAEHDALERRVVGVAFDGTGYGDDGAIWGGELFAGSVRQGLVRVGHLRPAVLPGGDAAAANPVQAAAGFLAAMPNLPDLCRPPFRFPRRFESARELVDKGLRCFPTTSAGRLFDTAAALVGFTRPISFEGQAAVWLEQLARTALPLVTAYPMAWADGELDFRPLLAAVIEDRLLGRPVAEVALAFHLGLAEGIATAAVALAGDAGVDTVVLSGGVFQNRLLLERTAERLGAAALAVWVNREVPANDGGISLGQAACAAMGAGPIMR